MFEPIHHPRRDPVAGVARPGAARKMVQAVAGIVAVVSFGCSAVHSGSPGPGASEPPALVALGANPTVVGAVTRSCDDCHSTAHHVRWNAKLAFSYWFPNHSLEAVDFEQLPDYDAERRQKTLEAIAEVVRDGEMPPIDYRILHPSGKLTADEKSAIIAWATAGSTDDGRGASGPAVH